MAGLLFRLWYCGMGGVCALTRRSRTAGPSVLVRGKAKVLGTQFQADVNVTFASATAKGASAALLIKT